MTIKEEVLSLMEKGKASVKRGWVMSDILKEIFRHFMVYEEPKKVIINTCSIKPVAIYVNTLKRLLADLEIFDTFI